MLHMCFGTYEDDVLEATGAQWIYCKCGSWIHEDYVEESNDGDQRYCTFCVDLINTLLTLNKILHCMHLALCACNKFNHFCCISTS